MAKFAYTNAKNVSTGYISLELNCGCYSRVFCKKSIKLHSRSRSANKPAKELKELIEVCCQNPFYAQKLQKKAHDKKIKSRSYASGEKIWLNSKYIKTQKNKKPKNQFFEPFRVFHTIRKYAYKLELSTK